jgi:hypothetical protein
VRGAAGYLRRFLHLHIFNFVWFQTAESFRELARNQVAFTSDMEKVEGFCRQAVDSVLKSQRIQSPIRLESAQALALRIERRVRGL